MHHKPVNATREQQGEEMRSSVQNLQGLRKRVFRGDRETALELGSRSIPTLKERRLTAVREHLKDKGHSLDMFSSTIVTPIRRRFREAMEIQCQAPALNRDRGFQLPAIYQDILSRDSHHLKSLEKASNSITR